MYRYTYRIDSPIPPDSVSMENPSTAGLHHCSTKSDAKGHGRGTERAPQRRDNVGGPAQKPRALPTHLHVCSLQRSTAQAASAQQNLPLGTAEQSPGMNLPRSQS